MVQICQFNLRKVYGHHVSSYFLIFIFIKFCLCATYSDAIDPQELIRRRNVAETYSRERGNTKKDWIETYHESFSGNSFFITEQKGESSLENEPELYPAAPSQNLDSLSYSHQALKDSDTLDDSLLNKINSYQNSIKKLETLRKSDELTSEEFMRRRDILISYYSSLSNQNEHEFDSETDQLKIIHKDVHQPVDRDIEDETVPSIKGTNVTLQESSESDNDMHDSSNYDKKQVLNSHESEAVLKSSKLSHIEKSQSSILHTDNLSGDLLIDYCAQDKKLDLDVKQPCFKDHTTNELIFSSNNTARTFEVFIKRSKFTSKKFVINGETLTLTEFFKLHKYLERLSFMQRNKNNMYSVNRLKIINSIGKIAPSFNCEEIDQVKYEELHDILKDHYDMYCSHTNNDKSNAKNLVTHFEKRLGEKITNKDKQKKIQDLSSLDNTKNEKSLFLFNNIKNTDKHGFSDNPETLRRKKIMNSYIANLRNDKKDWVETYQISGLQYELENDHFVKKIDRYDLQNIAAQQEKTSKLHSQERLYIIRWLNRLQNKLKDSQRGLNRLSISFSNDLLKFLGEVSKDFDIATVDEYICSMISNATLHNSFTNSRLKLSWAEEIFQFMFTENVSVLTYLPLNSIIAYILIAIFLYFIICNLKMSISNNNLIILIAVVLSIIGYIRHGYKIYQQNIAAKHSFISRVVPKYCENILAKESGIWAHIKEYVRHYWHDEECKRYYEAVMVDPAAEISPIGVFSDYLSDGILQVLKPFGRNLNIFFKELSYDMPVWQQAMIFVVMLAVLLFIAFCCLSFFAFRQKYKIKLPFYFGSIEPTKFSVGSGIEDVKINENYYVENLHTVFNAPLISCDNKTENISHVEDILKKDSFRIEHKHFNLKSIKYTSYRIPKIRMRHNSI